VYNCIIMDESAPNQNPFPADADMKEPTESAETSFPWVQDNSYDIEDIEQMGIGDMVDRQMMRAFIERGKDTKVFLQNVFSKEGSGAVVSSLDTYLDSLSPDQIVDMYERSGRYIETLDVWKELKSTEASQESKERIQAQVGTIIERLDLKGMKSRLHASKESIIQIMVGAVNEVVQKRMAEKGISVLPHYEDALAALLHMPQVDWPHYIQNVPANRLWGFGRYVRSYGQEVIGSLPELQDPAEQLTVLIQMIDGENDRRIKKIDEL
jgi:hypothetical protein